MIDKDPPNLSSIPRATEDAQKLGDALTKVDEVGKALSVTLSTGLDTALKSAVKDGAKLSDVLRGLALDVSRSLASRFIGGLTDELSGAVGGAMGGGFTNLVSGILGGLSGFAKGAAFDAGKVRAFANGGIVSGPTLFPMQGGTTGLMGEAGPEAILPLQRTADGRLGVAAGQGGPPSVTVNIMTQDADSFARSRTQIAATLARAVDRGRRNL